MRNTLFILLILVGCESVTYSYSPGDVVIHKLGTRGVVIGSPNLSGYPVRYKRIKPKVTEGVLSNTVEDEGEELVYDSWHFSEILRKE